MLLLYEEQQEDANQEFIEVLRRHEGVILDRMIPRKRQVDIRRYFRHRLDHECHVKPGYHFSVINHIAARLFLRSTEYGVFGLEYLWATMEAKSVGLWLSSWADL